MTSSLIVSTYNWPEALELVLMSIKRQRVLPDEVIIADDGSTDETKTLIENFQKDFPIPLKHVWIPDEGFRKTIVMNMAYAQAKGEYLIQLDGDSIAHPCFIKDHLKFAKRNSYVQGGRLYMSEELSKQVLAKKQFKIPLFTKGVSSWENNIRSRILRRIMAKPIANPVKTIGVNMAFWKDDFIKVNGYNEDIIGWGCEDGELAQRLFHLGLRPRRLKYGGLVHHIYHKEASRERRGLNRTLADLTLNNKMKRCTNGIDKYLDNNESH